MLARRAAGAAREPSLNDPDTPSDTGVGIEYQIPQTSKRIDVPLSGRSAEDRDGAVVIELNQWETADPTEMDGVVRTIIGGAPRDTLHPLYQAWSYADLLRGFNESIYEDDIALHPCARGACLAHGGQPRVYRDHRHPGHDMTHRAMSASQASCLR